MKNNILYLSLITMLMTLLSCSSNGLRFDCGSEIANNFAANLQRCPTAEELQEFSDQSDPGAANEPEDTPGTSDVVPGIPTLPDNEIICQPPELHPEPDPVVPGCPEDFLSMRQSLARKIPLKSDGVIFFKYRSDLPVIADLLGRLKIAEVLPQWGYSIDGMHVGAFFINSVDSLRSQGIVSEFGTDNPVFGLVFQFKQPLVGAQFENTLAMINENEVSKFGEHEFTPKEVKKSQQEVSFILNENNSVRFILKSDVLIAISANMSVAMELLLNGGAASLATDRSSKRIFENCDYDLHGKINLYALTDQLGLSESDMEHRELDISRDRSRLPEENISNLLTDMISPDETRDMLSIFSPDSQKNKGYIEFGLKSYVTSDPQIYGTSVVQVFLSLWNAEARMARVNFETTDKVIRFALYLLSKMADEDRLNYQLPANEYSSCVQLSQVDHAACQIKEVSLIQNEGNITVNAAINDHEKLSGTFIIKSSDGTEAQLESGRLDWLNALSENPDSYFDGTHSVRITDSGMSIKVYDKDALLCEVSCSRDNGIERPLNDPKGRLQ